MTVEVAVDRCYEARERLTDVETVVASWPDSADKRATLRRLSDAFDAVDTLVDNLKLNK